MLLIQNSPRQFSPSEGHGLIAVLQIYNSPHRAARPSSRSRGASASDDSDRERASLAARSARGATASAPLHPSPHEDPVPRVSDDAAAMLSASPVTAALFRPRADDPPFPRGAPSLFPAAAAPPLVRVGVPLLECSTRQPLNFQRRRTILGTPRRRGGAGAGVDVSSSRQ